MRKSICGSQMDSMMDLTEYYYYIRCYTDSNKQDRLGINSYVAPC